MAGFAITIMLGHPLGIAPVVQAVVPVAVPGSPEWIVALTAAETPASPGPQAPPVIS